MKLEGDYLFQAPIQEVWDALFDPQVLAAVMPGCEKLERTGGQLVGELNIKVGPVQGKFAGKVELKDIDEPASYTMIVDGRGSSGFVKATASVKLQTEGGHTRMRYSADAQVGGKLASVGQRLVEVSARAISKQALEGLHENIKIRAAASAQAAAVSAETEEPAPEVEEAEAAGEVKAPVAEEAKMPVAEEAKMPVADEVKAPVVEEAKVPVADDTEVPVAGEAKSPAADETKVPVAQEAKAPAADETKTPVAEEPEAPSAKAPEAPAAKAPAAKAPEAPAAKKPKPRAKPAPPPPVLKTVSQADLAAAVAKEVTKELVPPWLRIVLVLAVLALVVWLVARASG